MFHISLDLILETATCAHNFSVLPASSAVVMGNREYQRLRSMPKVQHVKPEPPSGKSGYKPKSRSDLSFNVNTIVYSFLLIRFSLMYF